MNGRPIDTEIEHVRCRSSRTHAKATRRRRHFDTEISRGLDAGVFTAEPPRFVVVQPRDYPGFELWQVAAGVYTLATTEAE